MEFRKILPKKSSANVERYWYLSNQELKEIIDQFDIFFQLVLQLHLFMGKNSKSVELSNMLTRILSKKESVQFLYNLTPVKVYLNDFNIYRQHILRTLREREARRIELQPKREDFFWKKVYDKILERAREFDLQMDLPDVKAVSKGKQGRTLEEEIERQIDSIAKKQRDRELGFDDDGCIAHKELKEEYIKIRVEEDVVDAREVEVCQYELELWKKELFFEFYPQSSVLQAPVLETFEVLDTITNLPRINDRDKSKFLKLLGPLFSRQYIPVFHKKGLKISTSYKFSHLDDCLLLMGLNRFGTKNFALIQGIFLPRKSVNEIKNRYKNCTRFKSIHNIIKHWKYKQTVPLTRLEEINFEKGRRWFGYNNYNLIQKYFLPNRNCRFLKLNFEHNQKLLGKRAQVELTDAEKRKVANDINFELFRLNYPQERTRLALVCADKEFEKKQIRIYSMISEPVQEQSLPKKRRRRAKKQKKRAARGGWEKKVYSKAKLLDRKIFSGKGRPKEEFQIDFRSAGLENQLWVLEPEEEEMESALETFVSGSSGRWNPHREQLYEVMHLE